eukprot:SAG31_NODE_41420_length_276_cov_0.587571_1_plen_76_part_00
MYTTLQIELHDATPRVSCARGIELETHIAVYYYIVLLFQTTIGDNRQTETWIKEQVVPSSWSHPFSSSDHGTLKR